MFAWKIAPVLGLLWACGDTAAAPDPLHCGTTAGVAASALGAELPAGPALLFLNRCRGGCALEPGSEDARRNISSIVQSSVVMPEFPGTDQVWNEFVDCVTEKFLPFEVQVTDVDPGDVPHFENVVSGRPEMIGVDPTVGGVAPSTCGLAVDSISFTFAALSADEAPALCNVAAHELGHTLGLEHQMLCNDPMTYLAACGDKEFRRVDARCGEFTAIPCVCGGSSYQNTYLALLDALGARQTRLNRRPKVRIAAPGTRRVEPNFLVHVDAADDGRIAFVRASVGGVEVGTGTVSPYVFRAPDGLPFGELLIEAVATDDEGSTQTATLLVELVAPPEYPDASIRDAEHGDRPAIIGLRDAGPQDADAVVTLDASGCACMTPRDGSTIALLIVGLAWLRRRRARSVVVAALALASCQGEDGIGRASGTLVFDPSPGTMLSFEPIVLTQDKSRMLRIQARNAGSAPVDIGAISFVGSEATSFSVLQGAGVVAPGDSRNVWITFAPTYATEAQVTLRVVSTDVGQPVVEYPVTGMARAPCQLFVTPRRQEFQEAEERALHIAAAGLSDCTITRISAPGDVFEFVDLPSVPFTIPSGAERTIRVRHVGRTQTRASPVRVVHVFEADGSDAAIQLVGRAPIWDCLLVSPDPRLTPEPLRPWEPRVDLPFGDNEFERRVVVTNQCQDESPSLIAAAMGRGWESFKLETDALPRVIGPNQSVVVVVRREPVGGGYGEIHLSTDDGALRRVVLRTKASVRGSSHVFVTPSMDFGSIPTPDCTSRVRAVTMFNFGVGAARVDRVELSGDPNFSILSVQLAGATLDPRTSFELGPNSSAEVLIEARASAPGLYQSTLQVRAGGVEFESALRAEGVVDGPAEETFTLDGVEQSDVLFVIDDSLSAEGLLTRVRAALPAWIGHDQRVAVTVGNPNGGAPSRCLDFEPFLESSTLGPAALLRGLSCLMRPFRPTPARPVGGLGAAIRFFEDYGSSFVRAGARLSVVMISDDDDVSPESPEVAARFLESLKGPDRPDRVAFHALTTQDPALCSDRFAQRGVRYQDVAAATGGLSLEGCAADLSPALATLSADDHRIDPTFALSQAARPSELSVLVDGVVVAVDANDGYTFDVSRNTVTLHGASASVRGAGVVVRYAPECAPTR